MASISMGSLKSLIKTGDDKLFWLKVLFAFIAALVCSSSPAFMGKVGVLIGLLMYLATYPVAVFVLKIDPVKAGGLRKMLLSGLITYLFTFTSIWTLFYTITYNWSILP